MYELNLHLLMVVFIFPLGIINCWGKLCAYFQESQFASRKVFVQLNKIGIKGS